MRSLLVVSAVLSLTLLSFEEGVAKPVRPSPRRRGAEIVRTRSGPDRAAVRSRGRTVRSPSFSSSSKRKRLREGTGASLKGYPIDVVLEGEDHFFGVQIIADNIVTKERLVLQFPTEDPLFTLVPGRYKLLTESSRKGFPQEAKYAVLDVKTGSTIEEFPKTHVWVNDVLLEEGQRLRITLLPAVRSYNAVFYRIGQTPVAHLFARPYPSYEFGPGEFNGNEQFSSAQIAIAFLGMRAVQDDPEEAERIRSAGVPTLRAGQRAYDPVLVFGVRNAAEALAARFTAERAGNGEDYRGPHHITFLVRRDRRGKLPAKLREMSSGELSREFARQILWMMQHNAHRPNEGDGYGGKTFEQVFAEAQEKVKAWPEVSRQSTELAREDVRALEEEVLGRHIDSCLDPLAQAPCARLRPALRDTAIRLVRALRRERMNYETYPDVWLAPVREKLSLTIPERIRELTEMEARMMKLLLEIAPGAEAEL